jgi:hypothetical protein
MALTKEVVVDRIEIVETQDEFFNDIISVQVRQKTKVLEDGMLLSSSFHRFVIHVEDDYSQQDEKVRAVCDIAFA